MGFARWVRLAALKRDILLSRPPGSFNLFAYRLGVAKKLGLKINSAIDGGAAMGGWTQEFKSVYPDAKVLCVEPRDAMQPLLQAMAARINGVTIAKTLIGPSQGEAKFHVSEDQSSMFPDHQGQPFGTLTTQPMTTIDKLVQELNFPGPDFIKLDLQGAELLALDGATQSLQKTQLIQLEISTLQIQAGCPLFADVVKYLESRHFLLYDVVALAQRPLDRALAQLDAFFITQNHPLRADGRWFPDAS